MLQSILLCVWDNESNYSRCSVSNSGSRTLRVTKGRRRRSGPRALDNEVSTAVATHFGHVYGSRRELFEAIALGTEVVTVS